MKALSWIFYIAGIGFCIAGFMGHSPAWVAAAMSFFAGTANRVSSKVKQTGPEWSGEE